MILIPLTAWAGHKHPERYYQERWCNEAEGVMEYVLPDRSRVDCLTDEYAVEVDFAPKWAEAIGQAKYYSKMTGRKPGIVLILEEEKDQRYLDRLNRAIDGEGFTIWTVK